MSLKQEIETWVKAIGQYDNNEFEEALKTFDGISDTSKILFNCGVIHATLGQHDKAVECYQRAIKRDNYLAVAYFQQGVSNFLVGDFEEALANFNDTLLYLRGNRYINYEQLGLKFKLYSCEVLFNRGLCYIYLQQKEAGMGDLRYAAREKETDAHEVIDEAIKEEADRYTVFSIGVGVIYRPNSAKVKNLKSKDYLGKARLIAATEQSSLHRSDPDTKKAALAAAAETSRDDRSPESISFAASNLVKPGLHSRSRQQSEPAVNRNMFPPTPPPEKEPIRPALVSASTSPPTNLPSASSISTQSWHALRPEPLKLETSSFASLNKDLPRIGTTRTASEPRGPSRRNQSAREQPRRLFMETTPIRPHSNGAEADVDEHPDELYELHSSQRKNSGSYSSDHSQSSSQHHRPRRPSSRPRNARSRSRQRAHYSIEEEDETGGTASTGSSLDEFEILNNAGGNLSRPPPPPRTQSHARARSSSRRAASRSRHPPELKNMRIKVHSGDDTRYIMLTPDTTFEVFKERVKGKFSLKGRVKIKVRDEGDLITMGDQDDWDMAVGAIKREMEKEVGNGGEEGGMGKMEVWVQEV